MRWFWLLLILRRHGVGSGEMPARIADMTAGHWFVLGLTLIAGGMYTVIAIPVFYLIGGTIFGVIKASF